MNRKLISYYIRIRSIKMFIVSLVSTCSDFTCGNGRDERVDKFSSIPTWRQLADKWNLSLVGILSNSSNTLRLTIDEPLIPNTELDFLSGAAGHGGRAIYVVFIRET